MSLIRSFLESNILSLSFLKWYFIYLTYGQLLVEYFNYGKLAKIKLTFVYGTYETPAALQMELSLTKIYSNGKADRQSLKLKSHST